PPSWTPARALHDALPIYDPNLITGAGKQSFLRLNVASTPRIRTREGEWGDGTTQWFAVKLFGAFAEHVAQSVRKGDPVLVRGRLDRKSTRLNSSHVSISY